MRGGVVDALSLSINDTVLQRRELICVSMCVFLFVLYGLQGVFISVIDDSELFLG